MLLVLISGFALSQAFRTVAAIMAPPLQQASAFECRSSSGLFAGAFHFSFGALQLFMGMGIDVYGVRRTVLAVVSAGRRRRAGDGSPAATRS
jgi:hypothetical protein